MTREEAIFYIKELQKTYASMDKKVAEAIDVAIEALSEPKTIICVDTHTYDKGVVTVFKKLGDDLTLEKVTELSEPIKVITDDTIEVRYTDFENIKRIILTNGDIFCKMFYEDNTQEDDGNYDNLIPDEYKTDGDLISRAEVNKAISQYCRHFNTELPTLYELVNELPSADAVSREAHYDAVANRITDMEERGFISVVRCKDCEYYKKITEKSDHGLCHRDIVASVWGENGYCSRAKMKGGTE